MFRRPLITGAVAAAVAVGLIGSAPALGADEVETATVTGRVTFNGEPVKGVVVSLDHPTTHRSFSMDLTGAKGRFSFDDVPTTASAPTTEWVIEVTEIDEDLSAFETYAGNTTRFGDAARFQFAPGSANTVDIELVPAGTLTGRVVDAKGKPVRGASVMVSNLSRAGFTRVFTNRKGYYTAGGLGEGPVEIDISANEFDYAKRPIAGNATIAIGETTVAKDIVLRPFYPGKVKAKISRLKEDDRIFLHNTKTRWNTPLKSVSKTGKLKFTSKVDPGTYRLVIGGTNVASKKFKVRPGKTTKVPAFKGPKKRNKLKIKHPHPLVVTGDGSITVEVFDKYGTPAHQWNQRAKKTSKIQKKLGKGRYKVKVRDERQPGSRNTVKVKVKNGKTTKKKVKLNESFTVTGTVTHGGQPVRGIFVEVLVPNVAGCVAWEDEFRYYDTRTPGCFEDNDLDPMGEEPPVSTDANGRFTLESVPAGSTLFMVRDDGPDGYQAVRKKFTITNGTSIAVEVVR